MNGGVRKSTGKHFGSGREGSTMGTVLGEEEEEKWRYRGEKRGGGKHRKGEKDKGRGRGKRRRRDSLVPRPCPKNWEKGLVMFKTI